jgi:hypothetical protein
MNLLTRWFVALLGTPIVGFLVVAFESRLESTVREILSRPALMDDAAIRADAFMYPLLAIGFVVLSWLYVVPLAWVLRRKHIIIAALVIAIPFWLAAAVFFRSPTLDPTMLTTTAVLAAFVGLPVFASAFVASFAVRPNPSFKRTRLRRSA